MALWKSMMFYNIDDGFFEAQIHGFRKGMLRPADYDNFAQCETLDDLKQHLQATSYGTFLANEATLSSHVIRDRAQDRLVDQFRELRANVVPPLATFMDFISQEYMISNVLKVVGGVHVGRDPATALLRKCHPLGVFDGMASLVAAADIDDMFRIVLIDSPIGRFFESTGRSDFDQLSVEYVRALLYKNWLEAFHDFCQGLGGATAEVMGRLLGFEADRHVLSVVRTTIGTVSRDDRARLFPSMGQLAPFLDMFAACDSEDRLRELLRPFPEYAAFVPERYGATAAAGSDGAAPAGSAGRPAVREKPFDLRVKEYAVRLMKEAFGKQMHYGVFYAYFKLKEMEVGNLEYIADCIASSSRARVADYIPIW